MAVLGFIFLSVIRLISYTQPIMVVSGILVSWVYLRFYQNHGKGVRGDMSESFEAATLFPPLFRYVSSPDFFHPFLLERKAFDDK